MQNPMNPRPDYDRDRDVNRDVDREVNREPLREERNVERPGDRGVYRGDVTERRYYGYGEPGTAGVADMVRWGPILAGFVATMGVMLLLGLLGAAVGLTAAPGAADGLTTGAAIWGAIVLIVSFFVGGWVCVRTLPFATTLSAVLHSAVVWALAVLFALFLAGIGLAGVTGMLGGLMPTAPDPTASAGAAWGAFIGMVLALIAAIVGGIVAMRSEPEYNR